MIDGAKSCSCTIVALAVIIEQPCRLRLPFDSSNRPAQADRRSKVKQFNSESHL